MKKAFSILSFLLITVMISGQYDPKENFYDAEFFFAEEDYEEALYSFTQVYNDGYQENANINYRIGVCLLHIEGRKTEAIPYLEKAIQNTTDRYKEGSFKEVNAPTDAYLYLGNAYKIDYRLDDAIKAYNKFLEYQSPDSYQSQYTKLQIEACELSRVARSEGGVDYDAGTLGQINNIRVPIFNVVVSGDLQTIAFMGKHKFYNGVYISRKVDGKWLRPYNVTPSIQSDGNQEVLSLSNDGNKLLLAWNDPFDSEIWLSEYANDRWNVSKPIGKPVNSKYYESHATLSPDGNTIYFTSNRKESTGGLDIFKCVKSADGTWGELILLNNINTEMNEEAPFMSPDGTRLYFSSQGHQGFGGYDIFSSEIKADGSLGEPKNLGYPLNTTDDDFAFRPKEVSYDGYLTIYAKGEDDQVDLFRFELIPEDAQPVAVAFEVPDETEVVAEISDDVADTAEEIMDETEEVVEVVNEAIAEKETETLGEEVEQVVEEVVEEARSRTYLLKPVFFDFDSYALSSTAKQKLDDMAEILIKFPLVKIDIHGHTDALGADAYNIALSQRRAKAVAEYLVGKGVAQNQLSVKALGESQHIAINSTPDGRDVPKGRALNRRVQFFVKIAGSVSLETEKINVPDNLKNN